MASSNIKLFDENKGNMLSDSEFSISNQRMNGLQTGVASSQLQNKAMYQASLVAYAIAQVMMQNGLNANDTDAVSTFVSNLSRTMLQKVYDIATTAEAQAGVATGKWMSPALVKAAINSLAAKAQNILSDETKALYGLGADATPDQVLASLGRLNSALPNDKIWQRIAATVSDIKTVDRTEGTSGPYLMRDTSTETIREIYYSDELSADENGNIVLKNYKTLKFSIGQWPNYTTFFAGKYIKNEQSFPNDIYFIPNGVTLTGTATGGYYYAYFNGTTKRVTGANVSVISSDLINTPADKDSEDFNDGKNYIFLGTIGGLLTGGVHIETGSYVGTGKYGKSNPNRLTFDFDPKLLLIFEIIKASTNSNGYVAMMIPGSPCYWVSDNGLAGSNNVFWTKNTVSWFNNANQTNGLNADYCIKHQLNKINVTYNYIVIG